MPATKPKSSSSSDSESETPPKKTTKKAASVSPKKTTKTTASKATTKATTKTTTATKKRDSSPKPKKRGASPARASPKPKKRAQKASPEPKKRKASPEPKKRKASPPKKRRSRTPVKKTVTKRKEESSSYRSDRSGSSDSRSRSRPPPKRKAPAREVSPKVKEKVRKEESGKARPQARSFLGALKAVKANQKDMPKPEDSWAKEKHQDGEEKEEVWDPTKVCGHPGCDLQVSEDRLVSEFFCCGKCSIAYYSHQKPQHGQRCEAKTPRGTTKAQPPPADPFAGGGSWKKKTTGMRWGSYGNGKSYGKAWSQWKEPESKESKEQTKGLRAWSDDDEPPVKGTNAAKKAQEKEEKDKDKDHDKGENSNAWSKWNSGGNGGYSGNSGWKKSDSWSNWSGGWKNSWSKGWGTSQRGGGMEAESLEEAEERRQKRLERFSGETSVKNSDKVCHINWSSDATKTEDADGTTEKPEPAETAEAAKKDQSEDERAKQIRTGERARSEDHEDD